MNVKEICEEITFGNGNTMTATKIGDLKCKVIQLDGSSLHVTLYEIKYVPEMWMNLFSLNKALKNGYALSNKGLSINLSKDSSSVTFDRVIRTANGFVSGIKLSVYSSPVICNAAINADHNKSVDVNMLHEMMGHCGMDKLQTTANIHGFKLTGKSAICKDCALAKARQKNVNKEWKGSSKIPGGRIYLDVSSVRDVSFGDATFCVLIVDNYTDMLLEFISRRKERIERENAGAIIRFENCRDKNQIRSL